MVISNLNLRAASTGVFFTNNCGRTLYQAKRAVSLAHTRMLRQMIREGRQVYSARRCIKDAQRDMAYLRAHRAEFI